MFNLPKPQQIRWNQNALRGEEARQSMQIKDDSLEMQKARHRMMMTKARQAQAAQAAQRQRQEQQNSNMRKHLQNGALEGVTDTQRQFLMDNPNIARQMMVDRISGLNKTGKPTALMQNLEAAGLKPGSEEYRNAIVSGTKRGMIINNQLPGAGKGANKLNEKFAEQGASLIDKADAALSMASKYSELGQLANSPNIRTGSLGEFEHGLKKFAHTTLGMDVKGVAEGEHIKKIQGEMLGLHRKLVGDKLMSDADRRAYMAVLPGLTNSAKGIALSSKITQKLAQGLAKTRDHFLILVRDNGGYPDVNVRIKLNEYIRNNPILTPDDINEAREGANKVKQNTPGAGMNLDKLKSKYGLE